ncbi:hypothetical protein PAHAL_1G188200 [Panicum hallii]|uniref:Uncharacterized protein n=1 Tax=Panicum hallii TaxID=206008 RepID=A0A2T8KVU4_9POAL|nr:hypothetical protein PAHAL_1G188200 [Panicum hallii]
MTLEIVEPRPTAGGATPQKRTLSYPISIAVLPYDLPASPRNPPSHSPTDDDHRGRRRRRRFNSPLDAPSRRALSSPPANSGPRGSVHARLGSPLAAAIHMAAEARQGHRFPAGSLVAAPCVAPESMCRAAQAFDATTTRAAVAAPEAPTQ